MSPLVSAEVKVSQENLDLEALKQGTSQGLSTGYIPEVVREITIVRPPEIPDDPDPDPVVVPPNTVLDPAMLNTGTLPAAEPEVAVWGGGTPEVPTIDPSQVDTAVVLDDLDGVSAANLAIAVRATPPQTHGVHLTTWEMDVAATGGEVMFLLLGPEDCGDGARKKFFRGIRLFGEGTARAVVFVDGQQVKEATLSMIEDAPHSRLLYLPRGTKGYKLMAFLAISGPLEEAQVLFDPLGTLEGQ